MRRLIVFTSGLTVVAIANWIAVGLVADSLSFVFIVNGIVFSVIAIAFGLAIRARKSAQ